MTDQTNPTGKEAVFDTDRAWERFEQLAAREPVPDFWRRPAASRQLEAAANLMGRAKEVNQPQYNKDGAVEMQNTRKAIVPSRAWRTERPGNRRARRLTAVAAAAVVAVGLFTTPLGDRALAAMMQTFRIQHMVGVGVSADDLASISNVLEHGSPEGDRSFSLAQYGNLTQSGGGEARSLTWDEAEKQMGAPLLHLENSTAPSLQPATSLTFNLNVKAVNRLLTRLGSATTLPAEADGKAIRLSIPDGIATEGALSGKPVQLLQFGKPELTVENGIDAETVREAVLGLPVLPDSLRTKLAAIGDWQSTLPVPARDGASKSLRLGGYDAVMSADGGSRYVIWLSGDRMGLLTGKLKDFPTETSFQRAAEELIQR